MICLSFMIPFAGNKMQKLFLVSSGTGIVASAVKCGPRVTLQVLMWPTEQSEFETPGVNAGVGLLISWLNFT